MTACEAEQTDARRVRVFLAFHPKHRLEMDVWFEMDVDMEGVPNGALPWPLRAGPSSDTSEESDGWRRELDDSEVAESYMDAKFGGEDADMVEIVGGW